MNEYRIDNSQSQYGTEEILYWKRPDQDKINYGLCRIWFGGDIIDAQGSYSINAGRATF